MSDAIPVNPDILKWARETAGLDVDDVALKMNRKRITAETVQAWERGDASPSYAQLEILAYGIYNRPLALFFFPEPPEEEGINQSFRTLPEYELERIPSRIRSLLRKTRVLQLNLAELYEGVNPAKSNILRDLHFAPSVAAKDMAEEVRAYLGIPLPQQQEWGQPDTGLRQWREAFEEHGVFVFKDSFKPPSEKRGKSSDGAFSGFCLYDAEFPVIYVNNNKAKARQIFTLFHELAHLLMQTGGVDTRQDDYIEHLSGDARRIEVLCNKFAGEFLVPSGDFAARTARISVDDRSISDLANLYCVSREVILRKLLDRGRVSQKEYEARAEQWLKEMDASGGTGGNYYSTKGTYLSERYLGTAFNRYYQKRISAEQLADYLGVKVKNIPGMENLLFSRGASA